MQVGSFGDVLFEVSEQQIFTLNNEINRSYKSKITEHIPIYGPGMLRHQGRELIEVSFTMTLIDSKVNKTTVTEELRLLKKIMEIGEYNYLVINGAIYGDNPFLITEITEKNSYYNRYTETFDVTQVDVTLKEYIPDLKIYHQQLEIKKNPVKEEVTEEESTNVGNEQKEVTR